MKYIWILFIMIHQIVTCPPAKAHLGFHYRRAHSLIDSYLEGTARAGSFAEISLFYDRGFRAAMTPPLNQFDSVGFSSLKAALESMLHDPGMLQGLRRLLGWTTQVTLRNIHAMTGLDDVNFRLLENFLLFQANQSVPLSLWITFHDDGVWIQIIKNGFPSGSHVVGDTFELAVLRLFQDLQIRTAADLLNPSANPSACTPPSSTAPSLSSREVEQKLDSAAGLDFSVDGAQLPIRHRLDPLTDTLSPADENDAKMGEDKERDSDREENGYRNADNNEQKGQDEDGAKEVPADRPDFAAERLRIWNEIDISPPMTP